MVTCQGGREGREGEHCAPWCPTPLPHMMVPAPALQAWEQIQTGKSHLEVWKRRGANMCAFPPSHAHTYSTCHTHNTPLSHLEVWKRRGANTYASPSSGSRSSGTRVAVRVMRASRPSIRTRLPAVALARGSLRGGGEFTCVWGARGWGEK
jgi:hypothetical protein